VAGRGHADLYQRVVGNKHSAWKKYIQRNADTFQQFSVEEGKWRMRLLCHARRPAAPSPPVPPGPQSVAPLF